MKGKDLIFVGLGLYILLKKKPVVVIAQQEEPTLIEQQFKEELVEEPLMVQQLEEKGNFTILVKHDVMGRIGNATIILDDGTQVVTDMYGNADFYDKPFRHYNVTIYINDSVNTTPIYHKGGIFLHKITLSEKGNTYEVS